MIYFKRKSNNWVSKVDITPVEVLIPATNLRAERSD